jgi:hypothetical protein
VEPGELILADRGYANRRGAAHVMDARGDVLVRLNGTNLPLRDEEGNALDLLSRMRTVSGHEPGEWPVWFEGSKRRYSARLGAIRKSAAAARNGRDDWAAWLRTGRARPELWHGLEN